MDRHRPLLRRLPTVIAIQSTTTVQVHPNVREAMMHIGNISIRRRVSGTLALLALLALVVAMVSRSPAADAQQAQMVAIGQAFQVPGGTYQICSPTAVTAVTITISENPP